MKDLAGHLGSNEPFSQVTQAPLQKSKLFATYARCSWSVSRQLKNRSDAGRKVFEFNSSAIQWRQKQIVVLQILKPANKWIHGLVHCDLQTWLEILFYCVWRCSKVSGGDIKLLPVFVNFRPQKPSQMWLENASDRIQEFSLSFTIQRAPLDQVKSSSITFCCILQWSTRCLRSTQDTSCILVPSLAFRGSLPLKPSELNLQVLDPWTYMWISCYWLKLVHSFVIHLFSFFPIMC